MQPMSKHFRPLFAALGGAAVLLLAGCAEPVASGSSCPTEGTTLTAQSFGTNFVDKYCTRCHSTEKSGIFGRHGAPSDYNFNTIEGVRSHLKDIDAYAAAGPAREEAMMPPDGDMPTLEERKQLGEWIACGAP
jgi:uncharacterized membrane protein